MSQKHKCTSPRAIQVHNRRKAIGTEEKLDTISQHVKAEQSIDICHNVRLVNSGVLKIHDGRFKERAQFRKFAWQDYYSPIRNEHTKTMM